ncbi:MAG: IS91 family transposase, partial [Burkholderiaceae bacterium]
KVDIRVIQVMLGRRRFIEKLAHAHERGELRFWGEHALLANAGAFARWLAPMRRGARVSGSSAAVAGHG